MAFPTEACSGTDLAAMYRLMLGGHRVILLSAAQVLPVTKAKQGGRARPAVATRSLRGPKVTRRVNRARRSV